MRRKDHRTRPLQVICVGLPRSGTESLCFALRRLGYQNVMHGMAWWLDRPGDSVIWMELARKKLSGQTITAKDFDQVIGDVDATTDVPTVWFAKEMLLAYPNAKIVLNRRSDLQKWKTSFEGSVLPLLDSWKYWWMSWFEAELFWNHWLTLKMYRLMFKGNFGRNAIGAYQLHWDEVEDVLKEQMRMKSCLEWTVEDGWEPLCQFLGKPVPDEPFPSGNLAAEFGPKLMAVDSGRMKKATRNAMTLGVACIGAVVTYFWHKRAMFDM